jgi:hypothetical protein
MLRRRFAATPRPRQVFLDQFQLLIIRVQVCVHVSMLALFFTGGRTFTPTIIFCTCPHSHAIAVEEANKTRATRQHLPLPGFSLPPLPPLSPRGWLYHSQNGLVLPLFQCRNEPLAPTVALQSLATTCRCVRARACIDPCQHKRPTKGNQKVSHAQRMRGEREEERGREREKEREMAHRFRCAS